MNKTSMNMSKLWEQLQLQSMVLPGVVLLVIFSYIPMWGVLMAFQKFDITVGFWHSQWVGLANFKDFVSSRDFGLVIRNTLSISLLKLTFGFPAPIILALMLNEVNFIKLKRFFQTCTYLPYFLSWVVVASMVFSMFADRGPINSLLTGLHILPESKNFMSDQKAFWPILVTANVWKDVGFSAIIYIAAITGVNPELYEAAEIDGAGRLRKIAHITLPCISPQIIILLILAISGITSAGFEDIYLLTNSWKNGVLIPVANVIDTHVYRMGVVSQRYSYATAVGLFNSVISVILLVFANNFSRKISGSSLW